MDSGDKNIVAREESVKRCFEILLHSSSCTDNNCTRSKCSRLKKVLQHVRECKKRQENQCIVCKQVIALCCFHAKKCDNHEHCTVPFCKTIRSKLNEKMNEKEIEEVLLHEFELLNI